MKIIGLTGVARSGKDTVAGMIREMVPGAKRQGFADALKLSAARLFFPDMDVDRAVKFCNWLKEHGEVVARPVIPAPAEATAVVPGRTFLQHYGTEAHRDVFGEDFWLDAVLPLETVDVATYQSNKVERIPAGRCVRDDCDLLLIPDVRFRNEAERVKACGGEVWKIVREGVDAVNAHASEAGVPDRYVDRVLWNVGTLQELEDLVWDELRIGGYLPTPAGV